MGREYIAGWLAGFLRHVHAEPLLKERVVIFLGGVEFVESVLDLFLGIALRRMEVEAGVCQVFFRRFYIRLVACDFIRDLIVNRIEEFASRASFASCSATRASVTSSLAFASS